MKVGYFFLLSPSDIVRSVAFTTPFVTSSMALGFSAHVAMLSIIRSPQPPRKVFADTVLPSPLSEIEKNATPHFSEIPPRY